VSRKYYFHLNLFYLIELVLIILLQVLQEAEPGLFVVEFEAEFVVEEIELELVEAFVVTVMKYIIPFNLKCIRYYICCIL